MNEGLFVIDAVTLEDFMKDVLDVKSPGKPPIPNVFSRFLEEEKEKPEDAAAALVRRRGQLESLITHLQNELETIDKRVARLQAKEKKTKRRRLK